MSTYRTVVFDFLTNFKLSFDDADIRPVQVLWWAQVITNRLNTDRLENPNETTPYISTYSSVPVLTDPVWGQYIELPVHILDLTNDRGVHVLTYNEETCCCDGPIYAQRFFQPTKMSEAHRLYGDPYEKPSPSNPYFYRVANKVDDVNVNRVYLLGIECIVVTDIKIALLEALDPRQTCSMDDEIPLPPDLVVQLQAELMRLGRFIMLVPDERVNDGSDGAKGTTAGAPGTTPNMPVQQTNNPEQT